MLGGLFSDSLKVAIVRRRAPPDLRTHLELHAIEYEDHYDLMHDVIESFLRARGSTMLGVVPMQIGYVQAYGKGSSPKGHGKGSVGGSGARSPQPAPSASSRPSVDLERSGLVCHLCDGIGHFMRECPSKRKDSGKQDTGNKGDGKRAATTATAMQSPNPAAGRKCHNCGKLGHFAKDCRSKKQLHELTMDKPQPEAQIGQIEVDDLPDRWVMPVERAIRGSRAHRVGQVARALRGRVRVFFVVDSGSQINVVPIELVRAYGIDLHVTHTMRVKGAGGACLAYFGQIVLTVIVNGYSLVIAMSEAAVDRPLL
jgi:hypothetical protein